MIPSILNSIKKMLGLDPDYDAFDVDIMIHINAVIGVLTQLGIGPKAGFAIADDTATWDDFLGAGQGSPSDPKANLVQSYVYLRVRFLFDPPDGRYSIASYEAHLKELEWRLNVLAEGAFDDQSTSTF
jgi:hypothetical protein